MIKNLKLNLPAGEAGIKNYSRGFTLVEIIIVLGITISLFVVLGGVMTSSFRLKNKGDLRESVQNEAQVIMNELKKNIFEADLNLINCDVSPKPSLSFVTKNGGNTILICDKNSFRIASVSAESGLFNLSKTGIMAQNCQDFVSCDIDSNQKVTKVYFNIDIGGTNEVGNNQFWKFSNQVVPR